MKIGDKIRINQVEGFFEYQIKEGGIYTVANIDEYGFDFTDGKNEFYCFFEDDEDFEYELVNEEFDKQMSAVSDMTKPITINTDELVAQLKEITEKGDNVSKHKEICNKLNDIYRKKNHDYGNSFGETYEKLGIISAVTRITDKVNRLQSLATKEQQVQDESIQDTLMDLANYSIMTIMEMEDK